MNNNLTFSVFGEPVEVVVSSKATNYSFSILIQTSPPGGGPPPHVHDKEDEIFTVLEGEFEMFDGRGWSRLNQGEHRYTLRGQVHTFRNCGSVNGRILIVVTPGGLDEYLEAISVLKMPEDIVTLTEISDRYGIRFITPEPPSSAPL